MLKAKSRHRSLRSLERYVNPGPEAEQQVYITFNRARMDKAADHPFLTGIHTPMKEELTLTELKVSGEIPAQLAGRYVRIGPNPFKPDPRGHHWFIGDGMVHGIRLKGGKAEWYRNRYIRSQILEAEGGPKAAPGPRRTQRDGVNKIGRAHV